MRDSQMMSSVFPNSEQEKKKHIGSLLPTMQSFVDAKITSTLQEKRNTFEKIDENIKYYRTAYSTRTGLP